MTSTTLAMQDLARTTGAVRPLHAGDVPALVNLRRIAFARAERETPAALAAYFRAVFLEGPLREPGITSLVHESDGGDVTGFLGVLVRRMAYKGRTIRAAIGTQLMVAPDARGLAGRRLAHAFMHGAQDLCISDTANDAARRLWASVGGRVSPMLSMNWVHRLRPWRHAAERLGGRAWARAARTATQPLCAALDRPVGRQLESDAAALHISEDALTAAGVCDDQGAVLGSRSLRPVYTRDAFEWLLHRAAEKKQFGPLHGARLRDNRGAPLGWFMYHLGPDGCASVLQVAARDRCERAVLIGLFRHAWERGAASVSGRAAPWLMPALLGSDRVFVYQGPWVLLHSRRPEVVDAIERGSGFLSRLDGEWWLSF